MRVLLFLRRGINQTRVRCRVLWLKLPDRFEIARVSNDLRELLDLFELSKLRLNFLFIRNNATYRLSLFSDLISQSVHNFRFMIFCRCYPYQSLPLRKRDAQTL